MKTLKVQNIEGEVIFIKDTSLIDSIEYKKVMSLGHEDGMLLRIRLKTNIEHVLYIDEELSKEFVRETLTPLLAYLDKEIHDGEENFVVPHFKPGDKPGTLVLIETPNGKRSCTEYNMDDIETYIKEKGSLLLTTNDVTIYDGYLDSIRGAHIPFVTIASVVITHNTENELQTVVIGKDGKLIYNRLLSMHEVITLLTSITFATEEIEKEKEDGNTD